MSSTGQRTYDNSGRRERAAATTERIARAGVELLRESSIRDWNVLTVRAVAERAGVHERTVYRHVGSERGLRDAVMERLEQEAGIDLAALDAHDLAGAAAAVLRYASAYPATPPPELDPALERADARRRDALRAAIAERAEGRDGTEHVRAAAVVDLLWSLGAFDRLRNGWGFDPDEAIDAIAWAIGLVEDTLD